MCWALLRDAVPLYPVYALLFADAGVDDAGIAALLMLWTAVAVLGEVPTGVLADRVSRRWCVVAASVLEAAGFATWTLAPTMTGFAAGFVLWGVGGCLASGAFSALLYDALDAHRAAERFADAYGRVEAAGLVAQIPAAGAAVALLRVGGFPLLGWVSVAVCATAALAALRLPDDRPPGAPGDGSGAGEPVRTRDALRVALRTPAVRVALLAGALLGGLDAMEEYIPLIAARWGVPTPGIPVVGVAVQLAAAVGALLGARVAHRGAAPGVLVTAGLAALAVGAALAAPAGLAGVALSYGLLRVGQVTAEARLQAVTPSEVRATMGSVASLGIEAAALPVLVAWGVAGLPALVGVCAAFGLCAVALIHRGHRSTLV